MHDVLYAQVQQDWKRLRTTTWKPLVETAVQKQLGDNFRSIQRRVLQYRKDPTGLLKVTKAACFKKRKETVRSKATEHHQSKDDYFLTVVFDLLL